VGSQAENSLLRPAILNFTLLPGFIDGSGLNLKLSGNTSILKQCATTHVFITFRIDIGTMGYRHRHSIRNAVRYIDGITMLPSSRIAGLPEYQSRRRFENLV